MPAGDPNFGQYYAGIPKQKLLQLINDPNNTGFYKDYRLWIANNRPQDDAHLIQAFHGFGPCRDALNAGDSQAGKTLGQVLDTDFVLLNGFVGRGPKRYTTKLLKSLKLKAPKMLSDPGDDQIFQVALAKYFANQWPNMSEIERAFVNGSIIAIMDLGPTNIGSGPTDTSLFAIPGYLVGSWGQDTTQPFWRGVKEITNDAFNKLGTRLVNITGAVQLRLGDPDNNEDFPPIKVAPGFHIMGGV